MLSDCQELREWLARLVATTKELSKATSPHAKIKGLADLSHVTDALQATVQHMFKRSEPPSFPTDVAAAATALDTISHVVIDSLAELAAAIQAWSIPQVVHLTTAVVRQMPRLLQQSDRVGNQHRYLNAQRQVRIIFVPSFVRGS